MKHNSHIMHYSVFIGIVAAIAGAAPLHAGVRIGNQSRSYANAYNQVNALREQEQIAAQQYADLNMPSADTVTDNAGNTVTLPVRVANADLAAKIANNDPTAAIGLPALEACSRIYPNGQFAWATPDAGAARGAGATCVSIVEMRALGAGKDGADLVLARANVAAGTSINCNISDFPESGYTNAAADYIFPADSEPTVDDVVRVMNEEQKKSAGLKIAAGAIIGGLGGNIAGKNEVGQDGLMGTGKHKMQSSAVGAIIGAGIGAGNAYAGKVGGDVILSAGVNAAAGGVVGNIVASGDSVLRIEDCEIGGRQTSCLWGYIRLGKEDDIVAECPAELAADAPDYKVAYYNPERREFMTCPCKPSTDKNKEPGCVSADLLSAYYAAYNGKSIEEIDLQQLKNEPQHHFHIKQDAVAGKTMEAGAANDGSGFWLKLSSATKSDGAPIRAMIADFKDGAFGKKMSDWYKWRNSEGKGKEKTALYIRDGKGVATGKLVESLSEDKKQKVTLNDFYPMTIGAEDGGIVDISNKARMKSTLTGAGVGGAMGGFVGYQGAQKDIDDRWVTAVREYKDSLGKVYCGTGKRFLAQYNALAEIPEMKESD